MGVTDSTEAGRIEIKEVALGMLTPLVLSPEQLVIGGVVMAMCSGGIYYIQICRDDDFRSTDGWRNVKPDSLVRKNMNI
jgi:hypothetical protein